MTKDRLKTYSAKPGSSLILVVVIISALIIVVFGANRLALVQYNQSTRDEDNVLALYAAKAGIEDGLLRFRYHHDTETASGKVFRFGLTDGQNQAQLVDENSSIAGFNVSTLGLKYAPNKQYYDLSVNYKTQLLGDFNFAGAPNQTIPKIGRDDFVELSGFEQIEPFYYLRIAFKFFEPGTTTVCSGSNLTNAFVQIERIVSDGTGNSLHQVTARPGLGNFYPQPKS